MWYAYNRHGKPVGGTQISVVATDIHEQTQTDMTQEKDTLLPEEHLQSVSIECEQARICVYKLKSLLLVVVGAMDVSWERLTDAVLVFLFLNELGDKMQR